MKCGFILFVLFLSSSIAFAQSTNATISGGVTDPSAQFIQGADVEIANDATGVIYSAKTNSVGMYLLPILPPGHYHVQVSKPGFKTIIKADVILNVQSALALNFVLPVGATSESLTVDASSLSINTTDASVSTVIDRNFVENTPLNGRSFQDLVSMTPGVTTESPQAGLGYRLFRRLQCQRAAQRIELLHGRWSRGKCRRREWLWRGSASQWRLDRVDYRLGHNPESCFRRRSSGVPSTRIDILGRVRAFTRRTIFVPDAVRNESVSRHCLRLSSQRCIRRE